MTICIPCEKTIHPAHTKLNIAQGTIVYNEYVKLELDQKHHLYTSMLLPKAVIYKNSFLHSYKKTINPIFTKTNRVRPKVICIIHTKFELNRMHHLDAIVFARTDTYIYTSP